MQGVSRPIQRDKRHHSTSRKLEFTELLAAICLVLNCAKGMSALQLSRHLQVQYKTAFVLAHKLREAMAKETATHRLDDEVEIDGAYLVATYDRQTLKKTALTVACSGSRPASAMSSLPPVSMADVH